MLAVDPKNPRGIVWLASFPRSGNTWLRMFINRLFEIITVTPVPRADMNRRSRIEASDSDEDLYSPFLFKPVRLATRQEIAIARTRVQEQILRRANGLVFVKTHNANVEYLGAPLIRHDLSAGGVYIVRNPLDVASSFAAFCNMTIDEAIRTMGKSGLGTDSVDGQVYTQSGSWSENVASWAFPQHPAILVVRYEDMARAPMETFSRVARHIGFDATAEQIGRAIDDTTFERLDLAERTTGFEERPRGTTKFFRKGLTDQWRATLTPRQVRTIVTDHRDQMTALGYLTPEVLAVA